MRYVSIRKLRSVEKVLELLRQDLKDVKLEEESRLDVGLPYEISDEELAATVASVEGLELALSGLDEALRHMREIPG